MRTAFAIVVGVVFLCAYIYLRGVRNTSGNPGPNTKSSIMPTPGNSPLPLGIGLDALHSLSESRVFCAPANCLRMRIGDEYKFRGRIMGIVDEYLLSPVSLCHPSS
jgi:hypothetical protein